jgi:RNA binding exosome subunit
MKQTVVELIAKATEKSGGNLVSVRGYTNRYGEVSNQRFNISINYQKAMEQDVKLIRNFDVSELADRFPMPTLRQAQDELVVALERRINGEGGARSNAQKDAYVNLGNGLRLKEGTLYLWGLRMDKQKLMEGEYPEVNSSEKTIVKKAIQKHLNTKTNRIINLKLGGLETVKLKGMKVKL